MLQVNRVSLPVCAMQQAEDVLPAILREFLAAIGVTRDDLQFLLSCRTVKEYTRHCVKRHVIENGYSDAETVSAKIETEGIGYYMCDYADVHGGLTPRLFQDTVDTMAAEGWTPNDAAAGGSEHDSQGGEPAAKQARMDTLPVDCVGCVDAEDSDNAVL